MESNESAYDLLVEKIRQGVFAEGQSLRAEHLASLLGVSRTPVREALSRLAAEGVVEIKPHRGARLRVLTRSDVEAIYSLRSLLEPYAAGMAARHATPDELDELERINQAMEAEALADPPDAAAVSRWNNRFHAHLVRCGHSEVLAEVVQVSGREPLLSRHHDLRDVDIQRLIREHAEIVDAVRAGDPRWAEAAMLVHCEVGRIEYLRSFARRAGDAPDGPSR